MFVYYQRGLKLREKLDNMSSNTWQGELWPQGERAEPACTFWWVYWTLSWPQWPSDPPTSWKQWRCSRKSRGMCTLTAGSCSMMTWGLSTHSQTVNAHTLYATIATCKVLAVPLCSTVIWIFFFLPYCFTEERDGQQELLEASCCRPWFIATSICGPNHCQRMMNNIPRAWTKHCCVCWQLQRGKNHEKKL